MGSRKWNRKETNLQRNIIRDLCQVGGFCSPFFGPVPQWLLCICHLLAILIWERSRTSILRPHLAIYKQPLLHLFFHKNVLRSSSRRRLLPTRSTPGLLSTGPSSTTGRLLSTTAADVCSTTTSKRWRWMLRYMLWLSCGHHLLLLCWGVLGLCHLMTMLQKHYIHFMPIDYALFLIYYIT